MHYWFNAAAWVEAIRQAREDRERLLLARLADTGGCAE